MNKLIILTGRSGSGKSAVLHLLEDYGFFYIDNLPVTLLQNTILQLEKEYSKRNLVIALDSGSLKRAQKLNDDLAQVEKHIKSHQSEVWYLDASDETLITRYNETRRKHPLSHDVHLPLSEALEEEKRLLSIVSELSKKTIDTTTLSINQLKQIIKQSLGLLDYQVQVNLFSFGFKYGMPKKMDYLFDVRCLPNPYWEAHLHHLSGKDKQVIEFFQKFDHPQELIKDITSFLKRWIPEFINKDRSYLDIAVGCTGGHHRSVYVVEQVASLLKLNKIAISTYHRESEKW